MIVGEGVKVLSAREVVAQVREAEKKKLRLREAAIANVVTTGNAVTAEREAVDAAKEELRAKVLAKLDEDLARLDAKVAAREVAAGEAVIAATGGELAELGAAWRESELRALTGIPIAELRRRSRRALDARQKDADGTDSVDAVSSHADSPATTSDALAAAGIDASVMAPMTHGLGHDGSPAERLM